MKSSFLIIFLMTIYSWCFGQWEQDTVNIYWPNKQLKYRNICCFLDTVNLADSEEHKIVSERSCEMWDENGNEMYMSDYFKKYKDIVDLEQGAGIGEDEKEYRDLIAIADKAFDEVDIKNVRTINLAIAAFAAAKDKIPDAVYPLQKLEEIQEMLKSTFE